MLGPEAIAFIVGAIICMILRGDLTPDPPPPPPRKRKRRYYEEED